MEFMGKLIHGTFLHAALLVVILNCLAFIPVMGQIFCIRNDNIATSSLPSLNIFMSEYKAISHLQNDVTLRAGVVAFSCHRRVKSDVHSFFFRSFYGVRSMTSTLPFSHQQEIWLKNEDRDGHITGREECLGISARSSYLKKIHTIDMKPRCVKQVMDFVTNKHVLKVLDIRFYSRSIEYDGVNYNCAEVYLPGIGSYSQLRTLVLKNIPCDISLSHLRGLRDTLEYLDLSNNFKRSTTPNLTILNTFQKLRVLDLSNYVTFAPRYIKSLKIYFNMWINYIPGFTIGVELLSSLFHSAQYCSMSTLSLREAYITDSTFLCSSQMKSLNKIYIDRTRFLPNSKRYEGELLLCYENLNNLTEINLSNLLGPVQPPFLPLEHYISCITGYAETVLALTTGGLEISLQNNTSVCKTLPRVRHINLSSSNLETIPGITFDKCEHTTTLDLTYNNISHLPKGITLGMGNLETLNLGKNNLTELNLDLPPSVKLIDVSNNEVEYITFGCRESMQRIAKHQNITLNLEDNRLSCGCDLRHLGTIEWIKTTNVTVLNKHTLTCSGIGGKKNVYEVDIEEVNHVCFPSHIALIVSTTTVNIIVFSCIVIVSLCYKYRYRVKTNLMKLQRRLNCRKPKVNNSEIVYDGFISYCAEDRFWVHEQMLPVLEEKHGFKLCVHYRDFPAAGALADVIVEAMQQSDVIIVVLSNRSMQKPWCHFELQQANSFSVKYGKHLVIIKKGSIANQWKEGLVGRILSSKIYIRWPKESDDISPQKYEDKKELFWQKVVNEMYHDKNGGCLASVRCCREKASHVALELAEVEPDNGSRIEMLTTI